jgi:hypothetical protein
MVKTAAYVTVPRVEFICRQAAEKSAAGWFFRRIPPESAYFDEWFVIKAL